MLKVNSVQEAFEKEGLDANKITVTGVPERHVNAVIALAKLFVVNDHLQPNFNPDYTNYSQDKYEPWFRMGSSSGVGFSYDDYGYWRTASYSGSRLAYENTDIMEEVAEHPEFLELYKAFMVYNREVKED
ncbi:hypothetical protein [Elizabethkingia ursingii]|uniref:hypothetical protein n=1 Tax=Elizabethkingia ursingii TaxID=1756150 RepID=UPI0007508B50|nr:hypothetical protein [Elizabethkingia ursingii]KUY28059.1 hypothetical protein ATB96_19685 [Elizabethkingia ursingii]